MKKLIKILVGIVVVVIVLLVVVALIVGANLGGIVKAGMETVGPKVTQTTLTVDAVNVSLIGGSAGVKNLVLGNPDGYKAPQSISVGNATISLAPASVLSDKIVIHSIQVNAPEITFEGNPFGDNNLKKIMANVDATTASGSAAPAGTNAPAPAAGSKPAKKLEVDDFVISGAKVHANLTGMINKEVTLPLPDIHFSDLGKGNDGITAADLTKKVLSEITTATLQTLVTYASNLGKDATGAAKDVLQGSGNAATQGVGKLKQGLNSLFGK
jgi:uncharacterized protein involved in outer membrane biogenesis